MTDKIPFDIDLECAEELAELLAKRACKRITQYMHMEIKSYSKLIIKEILSELKTPSESIPKKRKVWIAIRKEKLECDHFYVCSQAYDIKDQIPKESQCDAYHITEVELPADE